MFKDEYHPQVKKDLKNIDKSVQRDIKENHIPSILNNPNKGKELKGDLSGIFSYSFRREENKSF